MGERWLLYLRGRFLVGGGLVVVRRLFWRSANYCLRTTDGDDRRCLQKNKKQLFRYGVSPDESRFRKLAGPNEVLKPRVPPRLAREALSIDLGVCYFVVVFWEVTSFQSEPIFTHTSVLMIVAARCCPSSTASYVFL